MTERSAPPRPLLRAAASFPSRRPAAILAVLAGVYGIARLRSNPAADACAGAVATAGRLAPLAHGEVAALAIAQAPFLVPDLAFKDADGRERTLKDWRGRTVLLNLWATWCVPCRKEMPALDALERELGGPKFEVVAVNIDTRDPGQAAVVSQERRRQAPRLLFRPERESVPGAQIRGQGLRHADDADRRRPRLRARRHGRTRRVGRRRRREARQRRHRRRTGLNAPAAFADGCSRARQFRLSSCLTPANNIRSIPASYVP